MKPAASVATASVAPLPAAARTAAASAASHSAAYAYADRAPDAPWGDRDERVPVHQQIRQQRLPRPAAVSGGLVHNKPSVLHDAAAYGQSCHKQAAGVATCTAASQSKSEEMTAWPAGSMFLSHSTCTRCTQQQRLWAACSTWHKQPAVRARCKEHCTCMCQTSCCAVLPRSYDTRLTEKGKLGAMSAAARIRKLRPQPEVRLHWAPSCTQQ